MSNPSSNTKSTDVQFEQVENLAKVREILFGEQSRDHSVRLQSLEAKLNREASDIKNDVKVRLDALETFVKKELEIVSQRIKSEQTERVQAWKELSREQKELNKLVEKKFSSLEEQTLTGQKELRQHILDQSKTLSHEIQKRNDSLNKLLDERNKELHDLKVDRSSLAELFVRVAVDLKGDVEKPSTK